MQRLLCMVPFLAALLAGCNNSGGPAATSQTGGRPLIVVGVLFTIALLFAPRHGIIVKLMLRQMLTLRILADDIVALLYRHQEHQQENQPIDRAEPPVSARTIASQLLASRSAVAVAIAKLKRQGQLRLAYGICELTDAGTQHARDLIRSHRLWEQYLVSEADMDASRIHDKAERFEHFTDAPMQQHLEVQTRHPTRDPHGRVIPRDGDSPRGGNATGE